MARDGRHEKRSKHKPKPEPVVGNGTTGGKTPKNKHIAQRWPNGSIMDALTKKLWGHKG